MLSSVPSDDCIIVADLEAGIGTLTRLPEGAVDVTLVVVEPTPRSIDVAQRAVAVAEEKGQGRIIVVANKVADDEDRDRIARAFTARESATVPEDPTVDKADRNGQSPLDIDPESGAVVAIGTIAALLAP